MKLSNSGGKNKSSREGRTFHNLANTSLTRPRPVKPALFVSEATRQRRRSFAATPSVDDADIEGGIWAVNTLQNAFLQNAEAPFPAPPRLSLASLPYPAGNTDFAAFSAGRQIINHAAAHLISPAACG
jgi:hypothetical protein